MKRWLLAVLFVGCIGGADYLLARGEQRPALTASDIAAARAIIAEGVPGGSRLPGQREAVARYYGAVKLLQRAFDPCHGSLPCRCCLDRARWWLCSTGDSLSSRLCASLPAAEPDCGGEPANPEYRSSR
jgi:hypothetical protein